MSYIDPEKHNRLVAAAEKVTTAKDVVRTVMENGMPRLVAENNLEQAIDELRVVLAEVERD